LLATLNWSHDLLIEPERVVLRRLAIFVGAFTLEAVGAVVAQVEITAPRVVDAILGLVAKSLVVAETGGTVARYRLLDTTRAYALEKLAKSGEREWLARRHAEYYQDLFERAEADLGRRPSVEWLGDYARQIDNLRAALDWAFSPGGEPEVGVALTAAATPLWMLLSQFEECRDRVERALAAHAGGRTRCAMKLYAALGASAINGANSTHFALDTAWTRALEIAESVDDVEYQLRALWGLWVAYWATGRLRVALTLAQQFWALAASRSDPNDQLIGDRLIGVSEHFLGSLPSARRHLEHMLTHYVPPVHNLQLIRFQTDQRVVASAFLGRVLWLQGFPDQALRAAEQSVDEARPNGHVMSLSYTLAHGAYPVALWAGDLVLTERYAGMLNELSTRHALARWRAFGDCHQGMLAIRRGDATTGLRLLQSGLDDVGDVNASSRIFMFLAEMARALAGVGQVGEGLVALERAITRAKETEERCDIAELLRVRGELLLTQGAPGAATKAEEQFREALDWARQQGAQSWELRAATSVARLLRDQNRPADGMALLQPVYDRFTEGFGTADLMNARALLGDLR
jgi:predicted ATPase